MVRSEGKKKLTPVIVLLCFILLITEPVFAANNLEVVIHYVSGEPVEGKIAYQVQAYLSVLDQNGHPIKGLDHSNFSISEDSHKLEIDQVSMAEEAPINLVLLMDTSGSMNGPAINASRNASKNFISQLNPADQIALLSFNDEITQELNFTSDQQTARMAVEGVNAVPNAGTCLYDAAYEAIQIAATLPAGRRGIVLLTDGVDETFSGDICSTHTVDDVIAEASQGNMRVPIYTIGLGTQVDKRGLERLAAMTGGRYLFSQNANSLQNLFAELSDQLKSEYLLTYTTSSAPGSHTLVVSVEADGTRDQDSRNFLLPELPTMISILSPITGQPVSGIQKISTALTGNGEDIEAVIFEINGTEIGRDNTYPYNLEVNFAEYGSGEQLLQVKAVDSEGNILSQSSAAVELPAQTIEEEEEEEEQGLEEPGQDKTGTTADQDPENDKQPGFAMIIIFGIGLGLLLIGSLALILFLVILPKRKKKEKGALSGTEMAIEGFNFGSAAGNNVIANITVENSDDPQMIGQVLNITKTTTLLGRSGDNDIVLPKDSPISRHHAVIEQRGYQIYLYEAVSLQADGTEKRPTYGTFVDEIRVGEKEVLLKPDCIIRLGKRVKLHFRTNLFEIPEEHGEATLDGFNVSELTAEDILPEKQSDDTIEDPVLNEFTIEDPLNSDRTILDSFEE